jgi:hypothetical protein
MQLYIERVGFQEKVTIVIVTGLKGVAGRVTSVMFIVCRVEVSIRDGELLLLTCVFRWTEVHGLTHK